MVKFINKLIATLLLLSLLTLSFGWNDCPFGRVNCTYPGECGRYIDTNHNGICDHSEPAPTTVESNTEEIKESTANNANIQLTDELVDEYVSISGKELKLYTIKQICEKYGINPKSLKEKLKIDVPDDTTFEEIKEEYGISPSAVKKAIVECMIEEGKIKLNASTTNEKIESNQSLNLDTPNDNGNTIWDRIISFLFSTINLRDLLFGWL